MAFFGIVLPACAIVALPLLLEKVLPAAAGQKGFKLALCEVLLHKTDLEIRDIKVRGGDVNGTAKSLIVSYRLWPPSIGTISCDSPDLQMRITQKSFGDHAWARNLFSYFKRISVINGRLAFSAAGWRAVIEDMMVTAESPEAGVMDGDEGSISCSRATGKFEFQNEKLKIDGDVKGGIDWITSDYDLTIKGKAVSPEQNNQHTFTYDLNASGTLTPFSEETDGNAVFSISESADTATRNGFGDGSPEPRHERAVLCVLESSCTYSLFRQEEILVNGDFSLAGEKISKAFRILVLKGGFTFRGLPDAGEGRLKLHFALHDLPVLAEIYWPGEKDEAWTASCTVSARGLKASDIAGPVFGGSVSMDARLDVTPSGWRAGAVLSSGDLAWAGDENTAVEDVDLRLDVEAESSILSAEHFDWKADLKWNRGAALYYPWFMDLSEVQGCFRAGGSVDGSTVQFKTITGAGPATVTAGGFRLDLDSIHRKGGIRDSIKTGFIKASGGLDLLYRILVKAPFSGEYPVVLSSLEPSGGWKIEYRDGFLSGEIQTDSRWSGEMLAKDLHVGLVYPVFSKACRPGTVRWKGLFLPGITVSHTHIPVILCRNRLEAGPVEVAFEGGRCRVDSLQADWGTEFRFVANGLECSCKDIRAVLPGFPVPAEIRWYFRKCSWDREKGRLMFDGKISVNAAGGVMEADSIWIEPFAPVPRYGADIMFQGLDLDVLSTAGGIGHVTGRISGHIRGLIVSGNEPEAFELEIRNDRESGISQKISLAAVENISVLGGGGAVPVFGRFFKEFSYRKIGISCTLRNDVFILHGLIRKNGQEFLVERGFWGGVNVINRNPGGRISFKDMMDRLRSIRQNEVCRENEDGSGGDGM
ncbi:MAG TPA: hypothetical protein EYP57_06145 [Thermodesulfobacteriaceae bacterium]|nr:hypothetical protein [Thermodesulfobacteriaceae bacterium]